MKAYKINGEIKILGDSIDFLDLGSKLNIEPSRILRKEDSKFEEYNQDVFIIETGYMESLAIDSQAQLLMQWINPHKEFLKNYCSTHELEVLIQFVIESPNDSWPVMILSKQVIAFADFFAADIHFDLYGCLAVNLEDYVR